MAIATKKRALTARQREVVAAIESHFREHGCAPTVREIARETGINSPNGVLAHLRALQRKGVIEFGGSHRSIRFIGRSRIWWAADLELAAERVEREGVA